MAVRVDVRRELLEWARDRSGLPAEDLARRFPKFGEWLAGDINPTLKQLETFAQATHAPIGFLLLEEPPEESMPIPDFRTMGDATVRNASADLLDTVYQCQQRQEWYSNFARTSGEGPVKPVASIDPNTDTVEAARVFRNALDFGREQRGGTWSEALRRLAEQAENVGVLVMVNGVVGSNTHRKLNPREFRGFALVDALAPLVFINGADTKAAQIFTLAHELAHIWLGESALSNASLDVKPQNSVERWCNDVAAEFLVPRQELITMFDQAAPLTNELERVAREFKVSTLVVLRRVYDTGFLAWSEYQNAYQSELDRVLHLIGTSGSGGNFYNTQPIRVSKRFARALISSTLEGQTLHRDAFQLLGFKKVSTFKELSERMGVA